MMLVSRSVLVEKNGVEVFHHYGVHLSSSLLMQIFSQETHLLLGEPFAARGPYIGYHALVRHTGLTANAKLYGKV